MSNIKVSYADVEFKQKHKSLEKCSESIRRAYLMGQKQEVLVHISLELCEEILRKNQIIKLLKEQLENYDKQI